jgi:MFS family permease
VAIAASILTGASFFGAVLFLSLFMVNVLGTTATAAGSAQIPLMLAFVVSSIVASALVQRRGRYKAIIVAGFVVQVIGFVLLAQIGPQSSLWDVSWRMVVVGLGMGPAMPLLNLAVQNAVSYNVVGQATANRQFFLQLGQATGAALFGVLLTTSLAAQIAANVVPLVEQLPPPQRALVDVAQLASVSVGEGAASSPTTSIADRLAAADPANAEQARAAGAQIDHELRQSIATSITRIYWIAAGLVSVGLVLTALLMPEMPLRKTNRDEPTHHSFE